MATECPNCGSDDLQEFQYRRDAEAQPAYWCRECGTISRQVWTAHTFQPDVHVPRRSRPEPKDADAELLRKFGRQIEGGRIYGLYTSDCERIAKRLESLAKERVE